MFYNESIKWMFHWRGTLSVPRRKNRQNPFCYAREVREKANVAFFCNNMEKTGNWSVKVTDKEFKRLKRADLIEIIYRLQENEEKYRAAIATMGKKLEEKQTKIETAGSIAEAAMALSNVFEAAQDAADRYLADIARMRREAEQELENARKEAARITAAARENAAVWNSRGDIGK